MKMKMIGVRVPEGSTIPERLKVLSEKTRYAYYELIEQWLDRDDRERQEASSADTPAQAATEKRIEELAAQVQALQAKLDSMGTVTAPIASMPMTVAPTSTAVSVAPTELIENEPEPQPEKPKREKGRRKQKEAQRETEESVK